MKLNKLPKDKPWSPESPGLCYTTALVMYAFIVKFVMAVTTWDVFVANMLQRVLKLHKAVCYCSCKVHFLVYGVHV